VTKRTTWPWSPPNSITLTTASAWVPSACTLYCPLTAYLITLWTMARPKLSIDGSSLI
jgi:hypothetical protein